MDTEFPEGAVITDVDICLDETRGDPGTESQSYFQTISFALPASIARGQRDSSFFQIPMLLKNHLLLLSIKPTFLQTRRLKAS